MVLPDVNVLVHARREDAPLHETCRAWLAEVIASPQAFGISDLVLSGFLRVVTHPRVFAEPTPRSGRPKRSSRRCVVPTTVC